MRRKLVCFMLLVCMLATFAFGCSENEKTKIKSLDDINKQGFNLGVPQGSNSEIASRELFPNAQITVFNSVADAVAAVSAGKLDGFAFDEIVLNGYCQADDTLTVMDETFGDSAFYIGMAKGSENLLKNINAVIKTLKEDGTLDDMEERWIDGVDRAMPNLIPPENPVGTLRILTDAVVVPFGYISENAECIGFDIEFGMRIAYALNMDYSVQTMNFESLIPSLLSGKGDIIISNLTYTEERAKQILYSDQYLASSSGVLVLKERYETAPSVTFSLTEKQMEEALSTAKIGVTSGSITEIRLKDRFADAQIMDYNSRMDALTALAAGRIDYAVLPNPQVILFVTQQNGGFAYCTNPLYVNPESYVVAKGNDELRNKINLVIARFKEDGTIDHIFEKWTAGQYSMDDVPKCTEGEVLNVAISTTDEPISFIYNNEIAGFDCELIQRIAYELGMQVNFMNMSFGATLNAVASGKADLAVGFTYTEERAKEVDFTDAYFDLEIVMVQKNESAQTEISALDKFISSFTGTFITENRWKLFVDGIKITVIISVCAYIMGTVVGIILCVMLNSRSAFCRGFAAVYGKTVTGIPILVWLMILYYMVFKSVDIPAIVVAVIGFGLETGASLSGVFKTGLDSVDKGQIEAATALGFMPFDTFRRIVFPQAAARIFNLYMGQFVSLVKSTSVVGYIAIMDLTKVSDIVRSRTYQAFFPLIATALIYFGVTSVFIELLKLVQRRLNPRLRKNVLKGVKTR